jgi:hypothetical protein
LPLRPVHPARPIGGRPRLNGFRLFAIVASEAKISRDFVELLHRLARLLPLSDLELLQLHHAAEQATHNPRVTSGNPPEIPDYALRAICIHSDATCRLENMVLVFGREFVRRTALTPAALFVALLKAAGPLVLGSRWTWGTSSFEPTGHQGHSFPIPRIRPPT